MAKVRCKFCKFEQQRMCMQKKQVRVAINKKRICSTYQVGEKKIMEWAEKKQHNIKPEVTLRPDWLWDRKKRREVRDRIDKESLAQYQATVDKTPVQVPTTKSPSHPVTGDLSRFLESTVEKIDE